MVVRLLVMIWVIMVMGSFMNRFMRMTMVAAVVLMRMSVIMLEGMRMAMAVLMFMVVLFPVMTMGMVMKMIVLMIMGMFMGMIALTHNLLLGWRTPSSIAVRPEYHRYRIVSTTLPARKKYAPSAALARIYAAAKVEGNGSVEYW